MAVIATEINEKVMNAIRTLSRFSAVRAAYLFGSQTEGTADEWSDIDVAVFMDGVEEWDIKKRASVAARVMIEVGSEVEVHLFPVSSLEHPDRGSFAEYVLKHGVKIMDSNS